MTHAFAYEHLIATTPDWPEPGVLFRDISPLLAQRFGETIEALAALITNVHPQGAPHIPSPFKGKVDAQRAAGGGIENIDAFAGMDARGFIFASALAQKFGKNLVIIRKEGKLPPPSFSEAYMREYGPATFELKPATPINTPLSSPETLREGQGGDPTQSRAPRIVLIDDVLATGGTLRAAADLCARAGYDVVGLATLINLKFLNDFEWNGLKVKAVVEYE